MPDKKLAQNTLALYALTGSSYVFSFVTIPYLTRVLGAETYGAVGFGTAFAAYVQLFVGFGFILSGTAEIVQSDRDASTISVTLTAVTLGKLVLTAICAAILLLLCAAVPQFGSDPLFFFLYLLYASATAILPDFVYRGLENMKMVTIGTLVIRALFLVGVFVFVKDESQYIMVPFFYLIGAIVADGAMFLHLRISYGIRFCRVSWSDVRKALTASAQYFVSRIASTFYTSFSTIILGLVAPGSTQLGQFTACNNVVNAGKNLSSPIADSLYPFMLRTKNFRLLNKTLAVGEFVLIPLCVVAWAIAPDLCSLLFGEDYREAGNLLRLLLPLIPISLASYLLGFPALTPMGLSAVANSSVVVGAVVQIASLTLLACTGALRAETICISMVVTESVVMILRLIAYARGRVVSRKES